MRIQSLQLGKILGVFTLWILAVTNILAQPGVEFNVRLTEPIPNGPPYYYSVFARNTMPIAPTIPTTLPATINVTVRIPGNYAIDDSAPGLNTIITSLAHGIYQENASRNNPTYDPENDFLYFIMTNPLGFNFPEWESEAGIEVELFRFQILDGSCEEGVVSMVENDDPITLVANESSQDFTNQMVLDAGNLSTYSGNYDAGFNDCSIDLNLEVDIKVFLEAAYDPILGIMRDELRINEIIPVSEPYTNTDGLNESGDGIIQPYQHQGNGGGEVIQSPLAVFGIEGPNAIVDWVFLEIRAEMDSTQVVATQSALLQRDGDVVGTDGIKRPAFSGIDPGNYYLAIHHRNHLGTMTATPFSYNYGEQIVIDFTDINTANYILTDPALRNDYPQKSINNSVKALWLGDNNSDGKVIYQGPNNDRTWIYNDIFSDPNNTSNNGLPNNNYVRHGYWEGDTRLDGDVRSQGPQNDVDPIFFTIMGHPKNANNPGGPLFNFIIYQQVPK